MVAKGEVKNLKYLFFLPAFVIMLILPNLGVALLLVVTWFVGLESKNINKIFIISIIFYFSITLATKQLVGEGNDYVTYFFNTQNDIYPTWDESKLDFLFWFIASLIMKYITGDNSFTFFIIINAISFIPYYYFFEYYRKNTSTNDGSKMFSFFLIIFITSFSFWNLYGNYIRQAWVFSYSIGLMIALLERRYLCVILTSVIIISSHSTGVLFVAIITSGFIFKSVNLKVLSFYTIIVCLMLISLPIFNFIAKFVPTDVASKLDFYSSWTGSDFGKVAAIRLILAYVILYFIDFMVFTKEDRCNPLYHCLYFSFIMMIIAVSLVSDITKVVERLYYPAFVLFFLIFSLQYQIIIKKMNKHNQTIMVALTLVIGVPLLLYSLYSSLFYNMAYFNGSLTNFLFYNTFDYYE